LFAKEIALSLHNEIVGVYNYMASINHYYFINVFPTIRTYGKILCSVDGAFVLR
jgi:hypothetical protein